MIPASKLSEAFPKVSPGTDPMGARVLVQLRTVRERTASGIVLVDDTKQFNKGNTQFAKVLALGPIAFRNRDTGELWKEGVWCQVGDYVRIPKFGGDRFERLIPDQPHGGKETALFAIFSDHELIARIDPDAFEELDELL